MFSWNGHGQLRHAENTPNFSNSREKSLISRERVDSRYEKPIQKKKKTYFYYSVVFLIFLASIHYIFTRKTSASNIQATQSYGLFSSFDTTLHSNGGDLSKERIISELKDRYAIRVRSSNHIKEKTMSPIVENSECECRPSVGKVHRSIIKQGEDFESTTDELVVETQNGELIANEFEGEFGYELIGVLPFLYFHNLNRRLISTSSCGNMRPFYFFSHNHTTVENCEKKDVENNITKYKFEKGDMHKGHPPERYWIPPPFKTAFCACPNLWKGMDPTANLVIISNKYTMEWQGPPINYLNVSSLINIVNYFLQKKFYVIYNRASSLFPNDPDQPSLDFDDFPNLEARFGHSKRFKFMHTLSLENPNLSLNEVQVRMMAKCRCFLSVQGGNSIFSSYFGGWNIIYAVKGQEIMHNAYDRYYHKLSGARIEHTNDSSVYEKMAMNMADSYHCTTRS